MIAENVELERLRRVLDAVPDPEIPVLSVVDLGIVRGLAWEERDGERALVVTVTTTYSGCPATRTIHREIERALAPHVPRVRVVTTLSPPWTTDWITESGREKLRAYGISPPAPGAATLRLGGAFGEPNVTCPRCGSSDVEETSRFGSTPCKSLYRCHGCREPFDHFKCH